MKGAAWALADQTDASGAHRGPGTGIGSWQWPDSNRATSGLWAQRATELLHTAKRSRPQPAASFQGYRRGSRRSYRRIPGAYRHLARGPLIGGSGTTIAAPGDTRTAYAGRAPGKDRPGGGRAAPDCHQQRGPSAFVGDELGMTWPSPASLP